MARFRMAIRRSPKSDPQVYRLYRMEKEALAGRQIIGSLTRAEVRRLVHSIARGFYVTQPVVQFKDIGPWSGEWEDGTLRIHPLRGMDVITVAHEMAHHIHEELAVDNDHENHGPQFVCVYMCVLDAMRVLPVVAFRALLKDYKIDYIDPGKVVCIATLKRRILR